MTYDELLERVNRIKIVSCDENIDFEHVHSLNEPKACNECLTCMGLSALHLVAELHKPMDLPWEIKDLKGCEGCGHMYPCKTIEIIEKGLG